MQIRHLPSLYVLGKLYNDIAFMDLRGLRGRVFHFVYPFFILPYFLLVSPAVLKTKKSPPFISKPGQA